MKQTANADTAAASAVATTSIEDALETGFLPEDNEYRLTGKLPVEKESDDENEETEETDTTAGTEGASAAAKEKDENADTAAASAAATTQEKEGTRKSPETSENRYRKLSRENRELKEKIARFEGREEGRQSTQQTRETEQRSQTATDGKEKGRPEPKIDDVDSKTGKAKYATWEEFNRDQRAWDREQVKLELQESTSQTERQRAVQTAEAELAKGMVKKFEASRAKYKDFDEVALNPDLRIPKGSVTDAFLLDSEHAGEVAYRLGKHPELLEGFYSAPDTQGRFQNLITPQQQFRKLMQIEAEVSGTKTAPAKPVTQAPRPPHQVDGKNAVTKDAVEQALADADTDTYMSEANSKDPRLAAVRAARKGK